MGREGDRLTPPLDMALDEDPAAASFPPGSFLAAACSSGQLPARSASPLSPFTQTSHPARRQNVCRLHSLSSEAEGGTRSFKELTEEMSLLSTVRALGR